MLQRMLQGFDCSYLIIGIACAVNGSIMYRALAALVCTIDTLHHHHIYYYHTGGPGVGIVYLNKLYVRASVVVPYGRYPRVPGPTISELVCSISLTSRYFQKLLISHQNLRRWCAVCGVGGGGCVRKANKQGRKQKKKSKTVENCSFKLKTALFILSHNNNNSFKYVAIHSLP